MKDDACEESKKKDEIKYSFDQLLEDYMGSGGRWQCFTFLLLLSPMSVALSLFPVFAQITPPHRCRIPLLDINLGSNSSAMNLTYSQVTELTIPMKPDPNLPPVIGQAYQPCEQYTMGWLVDALRLTNGSFEALLEFRNALSNDTLNKTEACSDGYAYDTALKEHQGTVIQDFDLVCDRAYWDPLSTTLYLLSKMSIIAFSGYMSDTFGRKKVLCMSLLFSVIFTGCTSLSNSIMMFVGFRTLIALCTSMNYSQGYIYVLESTNSFHRNIFCAIFTMGYSVVGVSVYTALCFFLPSWRWVNAAMGSTYLVVIVIAAWLQESPRWLIATGREEEAFKAITYIAKFNKRGAKLSLTEEQLKEAIHIIVKQNTLKTEKEIGKLSALSIIRRGLNGVLILFRKPKLRLRTIVLSIFWFHVAMDYYMMNFMSTKITGNAYLNFLLICVSTSLPATGLQYVLTWKVGRKWSILVSTYVLVAIFAVVAIYQIINPENINNLWLIIFLSLGKVIIEATFGIIYLYTPELFSTDVASYGTGMCNTVGRLGSALAPYVVHLSTSTWRPIPVIVGGTISLLTASCMFALPESNKMHLHATVNELETHKEDSNLGLPCLRRRNAQTLVKEAADEIELDALM